MNKSPKKVTAVTLSTTVIGCIITLGIGFYFGLNWEGVFKNFKPYLGFKTTSEEKLNLDSVQHLYSALKENYDGDLDKTKLIEGAKKGLVAATGDKYTEYMTASESTDYKKSLEGTIDDAGIGVSLSTRDGYTRVIRTLPDNPARRAGVLAGDIIYAVDDKEIWNETTDSIATKLRGQKGSKLKLTIVRGNQKLDFELTREAINNVSADISYDNNIAILSIYRFSKETGTLVRDLAKEAISKNVKGIIIDLRNNGGGYVSAARDIISLWVDGEVAMKQKSRTIGNSSTLALHGTAILKEIKTVILINHGTASASEILASALQDYKKATIVGEKSYGKGVMQTMLSVDGGGTLKVTSAHWYSPNGHGINESGIEPDEKVERTYEQINKDEDPQLDKAKSILN